MNMLGTGLEYRVGTKYQAVDYGKMQAGGFQIRYSNNVNLNFNGDCFSRSVLSTGHKPMAPMFPQYDLPTSQL